MKIMQSSCIDAEASQGSLLGDINKKGSQIAVFNLGGR